VLSVDIPMPSSCSSGGNCMFPSEAAFNGEPGGNRQAARSRAEASQCLETGGRRRCGRRRHGDDGEGAERAVRQESVEFSAG
jgi:hypothetical protein